jgi:hypothetical protein
VVVKDCVYFAWKFFTHATKPGTFDVTPTSEISLCKMVQLDWMCSRDNWRKATNSQSIQSMKIVIRKKPD